MSSEKQVFMICRSALNWRKLWVSENFLSLSPENMSSSSPSPVKSLSNLERFLLCVTPDVPSRTFQTNCCPPGKDSIEYFTLRDLWDCYYEWSAFGAGIPMMLDSGEPLRQFYIPYLSAIQIYTSKSAVAPRIRKEDTEGVEFEYDYSSEDSGSDDLSRSLSNNSSKGWDAVSSDSNSSFDHAGSWPTKDTLDYLYLQYTEHSPPHRRVPLFEKISELARSHPALMTLKGVEISPESWMAVSWYPIYSIPCQQNQKDLAASFLTFHTFSSSSKDSGSKYEELDTGKHASCLPGWCNIIREKCKKKESGCKSIFPFGLATYKMKKDIWSNTCSSSNDDNNNQVLSDMYTAADSWLKQLNFHHHDFNFFKIQSTF